MFILMSFSIFPRSGKKWKISFFDLSLGCTSKYFPTSYKKLRNKNLCSILDFIALPDCGDNLSGIPCLKEP